MDISCDRSKEMRLVYNPSELRLSGTIPIVSDSSSTITSSHPIVPTKEDRISDEYYEVLHLMEECSEVVQACSKIIRFGPNSISKRSNLSNVRELESELGDVLCLVGMLINSGIINEEEVEKACERKRLRLEELKNSKNKQNNK